MNILFPSFHGDSIKIFLKHCEHYKNPRYSVLPDCCRYSVYFFGFCVCSDSVNNIVFTEAILYMKQTMNVCKNF